MRKRLYKRIKAIFIPFLKKEIILDHVKSWMIDELQFPVIYMDEKG